MKNTDIIDLVTFRTLNGLSQNECAAILQTSRAFISQIESGKAKLPPEKIEILLSSHFDLKGLLPYYDRLRLLKERYDLSFINENEMRMITRGETGISERLANEIVSHCIGVNFDWLISGKGCMFVNQPHSEDILHKELQILNEKLDKLLSLFHSKTED